MPTNMPPEYFSAERKYKSAGTVQEKIESLEELISTIPKHKGTDKIRADYRKKLSKLRSQSQTKKGISKHESLFHIEKEGAARVVVIGSANVGKSSIINKFTHASPEISESPYTTWAPTPGMMNYENVQIQMIDTPPLDRDYLEPELMDLIKNSDLMLLVVDLQAYPIRQYQESLNALEKHRIVPYLLRANYTEGKYWFIPTIIVVNKDDDNKCDEDYDVFCELLEEKWSITSISIKNNRNLDKLGDEILRRLDLIRIYSKPAGKEADMSQPFVLKRGSNIEDFAMKVHKDFYENLKSAKVWGSGVYEGQSVSRDHILHDGDIVELHI